MKVTTIAFLLSAGLVVCPCGRIHAGSADWTLVHSIRAPLDYGDPTAGSADLTYEFGARFDPAKPTVIVIADGQQFYVQTGATAGLQQRLFGERVNVVGLITRGTTAAFIDATIKSGKTDWIKAWRVFNHTQWLGDIESVRRATVGEGQVMLYGRSGGAYLVHQYLAAHSDHVSRAFLQSPVNPLIGRELGIRLDRFWETLGQDSPQLQPILLGVLQRRPQQRTEILMTLQRQHFFEPADKLKAARARLIRVLAANDNAAYAALRKKYQVDAIVELLKSKDSIPQNVRVLELIGPSGAFDASSRTGVSPLIETQRQFAAELINLQKQGRIPAPGFNLAPLRSANTEVSYWPAGMTRQSIIARPLRWRIASPVTTCSLPTTTIILRISSMPASMLS